MTDRDKHDLTRIENLARDVIFQCEALRRNGDGDELRFGIIFRLAYDLTMFARRGYKRWETAYWRKAKA